MTTRLGRAAHGLDWKRALGEVLLIVVGVLLALAVDDWRTDREDRGREKLTLEHLLRTTHNNEQRIRQALFEDSTALRVARRLSSVLPASGPLSVPVDSVADWLRGALWQSDFRPLTGTYAALLATGDLNLLRNDQLRADLATYAGELEGVSAQLRLWEQRHLDDADAWYRLLPYDALRAWHQDQLEGDRSTPPPINLPSLRRDARLLDVLASFIGGDSNRVTYLEELVEQTTVLRQALERELGEEPVEIVLSPFPPFAR